MVAEQCFLELKSWLDAPPPPAYKNPRTARMPPLMILQANAGKVGMLTRDEVVHLIRFSGALHDLSVVVNDMSDRQLNGLENREVLEILLSNACKYAADFFAVVPGIAGAEKDSPCAQLRKAYDLMAGPRAQSGAST
jgi:hypothetical protein